MIFLPRILSGLISGLVYKALAKRTKDIVSMGVAAFVGSMTNTVFYLGGLYIFAFSQTAAAMGVSGENAGVALLQVLLGIVSLNGVLEAVGAVILSTAVGKALQAYLANR